MLSISRLTNLPTDVSKLDSGSRCILPNGKEYILDNNKNWIPMNMFSLEYKGLLTTENLNNISNLGIYSQNYNSGATVALNYPTTSAGVLKVINTPDYIYQEYTVLSGQINENKVYVRSKYAGVWGIWVTPLYVNETTWNTVLTNSHTHANKSLLDSYNQSNLNISDAIAKKHSHSNLSTLNQITLTKITDWDSAFSWGNHTNKYVKLNGFSQIDGSIQIIDTINENTNYFASGVSNAQISFKSINVSNFGIFSELTTSDDFKFWFGYYEPQFLKSEKKSKFIEYDAILQRFTLGKNVPFYLEPLSLGTQNAIRTLTIDAAGKVGYIDGLPVTSFTETDPTVPAYVKSITQQQKDSWIWLTQKYTGFVQNNTINGNYLGPENFQYGVHSIDNNNSAPYADYIQFGGMSDTNIGKQNLISFRKNTFGIRQFQSDRVASPFTNFVDFWHTGDFNQTDINNWKTVANNYVTTDTTQQITGVKNFTNGFDVNAFKYLSVDATNVNVAGAKNAFGNSINKISDSAVAIGNDIFPVMNLQQYDPIQMPWNNSGYIGIGSAIFSNYTGDTNYRPEHNAHDSWIGIGRGIGAGFLDGTNINMIGTGIMGRNDVKYADCVTIIGKGFTNGAKTRADKILDPNRVVTASNGFDVHKMVNNVIGIGHENWVEDISHSVVIGSNLRPYTYVFNSLILGNNHFNMNYEGTQAQADMCLDNDVVIGMGVQKRTSRHADTHNLLIGMSGFYGMGSAPDATYRPLVEGTFKNAKFQVNGTIVGGFERVDDDLPYLERVIFNDITLPKGVTYNASNNSFTFDGTQASTSIKLHTVPANPNKYIYFEMSGSRHTAGTWGYKLYDSVDSGNGPADNWIARHTFKTTSSTTLTITTEGNFKGTLHIIFDYTDITARSIKPSIVLKDSKERTTFEIRTTQNQSILAMGLNSGKFLTHGDKTLILGNDILSETPAATDNVFVGNGIFKRGSDIINSIILGNSIGKDNAILSHSVIISNDTLQANFTNTVSRLTIIGHKAGKSLLEGVYNCFFGEETGSSLTVGSNNLFMGSVSGRIKDGSNNTFIGHNAGGYGLTQSTVNNTIVIGANAVPEVPNNTTTIGTSVNTDNFLYGTTHSHAFKVRGGLATQVMMANGTLKDESTFGNNTIPLATSAVVGGRKLFSDTVQNIAANAVTATASRTYGVQVNAAGQMVVNVPWVDTNTAYTHPNSGVAAGTYKSVTVNAQGHVTAGTNPTTIAGYGITDAMSTSHAANAITPTNISNWNTAFTNNHTHANKAHLDTIDQSLSKTEMPTFASVFANGSSGAYRGFHITTNGSNRWFLAASNTPENATNGVSSNLQLHRYNNDGSYGGTVYTVNRQTGVTLYHSPVEFSEIVKSTNTISVASDGVANDPYGKISVTRGTASTFGYFGLTRSGSIAWQLGIDTANNFVIGTSSSTDIINNHLFKISTTGVLTASSFVKSGGTSTQVLMADGSVKDESTFSGNTSNYVTKTGTNYITDFNWKLLGPESGLFINEGGNLALGFPGSTSNQLSFNDEGSFFISATGPDGIELNGGTNGINVQSHILSNNYIKANSFIKNGGTSTQVLMADGSVKEQSTFGDIGNKYLSSSDGSRNPNDIKPNTSPKSIRADFVSANTVDGGTGNYAGVMTYSPWDGTSASTGDSSYQLAFINETGINGSGNPGLRLRKGIDTTWGSWVNILTAHNGVTLNTAQTISGTKTFSGALNVGGLGTFGAISALSIYANGPDSGAYSAINYTKSGSLRFMTGVGPEVAGTGNSGQDYEIHRYDNAGGWLGLPLRISRANGNVTLQNTLTADKIVKAGGNGQNVLLDNGTTKAVSSFTGATYTQGTNITISGNVISVVNSPTFSGVVRAPAFYEDSLRLLKKNIQPFEKSGLDLIKELDIVTFDRKDESAKNKIGIIADDSPKEFLSEELDAVDLYKTVFIQAKAIQELTEEVNNLRELLMTKLNQL